MPEEQEISRYAEEGIKAVNHHAEHADSQNESNEDQVGDLLVNLIHVCDHYNLDFEHLLQNAIRCHKGEIEDARSD